MTSTPIYGTLTFIFKEEDWFHLIGSMSIEEGWSFLYWQHKVRVNTKLLCEALIREFSAPKTEHSLTTALMRDHARQNGTPLRLLQPYAYSVPGMNQAWKKKTISMYPFFITSTQLSGIIWVSQSVPRQWPSKNWVTLFKSVKFQVKFWIIFLFGNVTWNHILPVSPCEDGEANSHCLDCFFA